MITVAKRGIALKREGIEATERYTPIMSALEEQLNQLDAMGAHIAAAHLDAAISQLHLDRLGRAIPLSPELRPAR
ncbi:hypothetical protein IM511_00500 [Erythrobacteraceae bacterium E2-1 Yellow Sea]|nr:hypothetical protein [Erythrobacteraceae bacterium E2-1 Yellow Sea]